jgi:hypothetical protein
MADESGAFNIWYDKTKIKECSKIGIMLIAVVTGILKLLGGSIIPGAELAFYWK